MGALLRYPYEVRSADEYFGDIQDLSRKSGLISKVLKAASGAKRSLWMLDLGSSR
jgi:non-homologous end joining protein Ku